MKRPWLILLGGLIVAFLAYGSVVTLRGPHSHEHPQNAAPELAWLKEEFKIPEQEFDRIQALHSAYSAACAERCRQIDSRTAELRQLLANAQGVTPEIEQAIQEAARLRADCHAAMLRHFYEVRSSMPPEQGKRYFDWVVQCTFGSEHAAMISTSAAPDSRPHEHHHE